MKPRLTDSTHCRSRAHCETCRDREGGRATRAHWAKRYALPGGAVDFACPFGGKWGTPPARGLGDTIERLIQAVFRSRVKSCGGCKRRRDRLNRRFPYKERRRER